MAIDLNVDVGELFKNLLKKKGGSSPKGDGGKKDSGGKKPTDPFVKYVAIGVIFLVLIILYLFFIYFPMQEEKTIKEEKIAKIEDMKLCLSQLDMKITSSKSMLKFSKDRYKKLTKMFHSGQEIDDLYRHISMLALSNQLMVSKINKAGESAVFEIDKVDNPDEETKTPVVQDVIDTSICDSLNFDQMGMNGDMNFDPNQDPNMNMEEPVEGQTQKSKVAYYELKVQFEISGNYTSYTKFREGLAKLDKIININKENIIVLESETQKGQVKVDTVLAIYRLPANDAERYAENNNQEMQ